MEKDYVLGELIFASSKTQIQKAIKNSDGAEVILKKPTETVVSFSTTESFKKDFQYTKMLHQENSDYFLNMMDIVQQSDGSFVLVEEDEGNSLENLLQKGVYPPKEFLLLAKEMSMALHHAHSKQVLHRDVKLANFIFSEKTNKPKLIDFGLSIIVTRKTPSVSCTNPIGTFNYMPPEQTGRVNKNIDFRSDIYSLGITFYELLVGSVPFEGDKLALVHSHITKKIPNIKNVPDIINDVIQKMCSKNPSERYYSALGVAKDLEFISENLENIPESFTVGEHDLKEFQIPNKMYGRDKELNHLKQSITKQESNTVFISGVSGMGKSRLIEELSKDQSLNLLMGFGKFDQFNRLIPYSAFLSIIKSLTTKLLSENNKEKDTVISRLKSDLKEFGGILTALVPEVELIIGKKTPVEPLASMKDTKERLFDIFFKFFDSYIGIYKLVLVVDDLQWADASSFLFLQKCISTNHNIFIIGAYRDNEVGSNHPLMNIINENKDIPKINIQPLSVEDLNEMVSETLCTTETMKLSELIHKKTLGNPFFSREFINTLYEEELITQNEDEWNWDIEKVEKSSFSTNVIDFMVQNLKKKPMKTQKVLNRAACIGNTFKIEELKWIWDEEGELENELIDPVKEGWLFQISSSEYKFFHDRLQQASYELFKKEDREKNHFVIGNLLLKEFKNTNDLEKNIFKVIDHLNISKALFVDKKQLLKLNLLASKKSLENTATSLSLNFSSNAIQLSPDDLWDTDYSIAFELHSMHAQALFANYLLEESEKEYNILLDRAIGRLDTLKVYSNYSRMAALKNEFNKSYRLFIETLKMFDETKEIDSTDMASTFGWMMKLKSKISDELKQIGGVKNILNLKKCNDPEFCLFLGLIVESLDIVFLASEANPLMFVISSMLSLYLYLQQGFPPEAPLGLSVTGWIFTFFFKDPDGNVLTKIGETLHSMEENPKYNVAGMHYAIAVGNITAGTFQKTQYHFDYAANYAMNHGEYLYGSYSINSIQLGLNGQHFPTLLSKLNKRKKWAMEIKNYFVADFIELIINYISDLAGISKFNPNYNIQNVREIKRGDSTIPVIEAILQYHKGFFEESLKLFDEMAPNSNNSQGMSDFYERMFYLCLTLVSLYKSTREENYLSKAKEVLDEFESYADISTEYLSSRYKLMETYFESSQINNNQNRILGSFEEIYSMMSKFGLLIPSAVASELTLEYALEKEFPMGVCKMYLINTLKIWSGLGAKTKVDQLKKKYFKVYATYGHRGSSADRISTKSTTNADSESTNFGSESLDMMSIIKSSQALSVELTISSLIEKVMHIIIENTGAEIGALFLVGKEGEYLEASIKNGKVKNIHKLISKYKENEFYCSFLLMISKTLKKAVIINDVSRSEYVDNDYLKKEGIKSICIHPIYKGKKYIGAIYLENKTLEGIFDEDRKEILDHISSQLAISYENAKLYDEMNSLNTSYERFLPKEFLKQLGKGDVRNVKKGDASTKNISVLFSDIRSFTDITEKMNSEESFSFVNEILSYLAPIISKHNGFIDKFFGDCIMALFPYDVDDSLKCGFEMLSALKKYNEECRKELDPVKLGIGIHFGNVMIGTIGAEERIDATVISDTVNTASRVESLTKTLGSTFVVTDNVLQNSKLFHKNRYIGKYLLKGKLSPMSLFHMISDEENIDVENFTTGIQFFESGNFKKAQEIFGSLNDKTSKYLQEVSKKYGYYSFDKDWSGEIKIDKDGNLIDLENDLMVKKKISKLSDEERMKILNNLISKNGSKEILELISKQNPELLKDL